MWWFYSPDKNVGPKLIVIDANQIINVPNRTHCGESISSGASESAADEISPAASSSSGKIGESLSTVVSMLTVATVTKRRKAVSTREHFWTGWQWRIETPRGRRRAALAQSTAPWWKSRPWDHLKRNIILDFCI